jgi:hypothetical protein
MQEGSCTGRRGGGEEGIRVFSISPSPRLPVILCLVLFFLIFFLLANAALAQTSQPAPAADWLPRQSVELQALDKVTARSTVLDGRVGQTLQFGTLSITVTACVVRPPDQPADAAAFVQITDSNKGEPGFRGWMLRDEPAVSMFQHPLYDVRLNGCRA